MKPKLLIIANNNIGFGQSGGDTIFLEFIKNWHHRLTITVFGSEETSVLLKRYHLQPAFIKTDNINPRPSPTIINLIGHTIRRLFWGKITFFTNLQTFKESTYCYTVSDFMPDFIFGILYKIVNPHGIWLCGQYLFAPAPGDKYSPYQQEPIKGYLYFLSQRFSQILANLFADQILITSQPDQSRFPQKKVIIVRGGVDTTESDKYLSSCKVKPLSARLYDAVFQGRLHPQKGVLELIDIWNLVVRQMPSAKLAIIGDGQLNQKLKTKVKKLKLSKNIIFFGFQSGTGKYNIFKNSKIVLHPATYDSGGMSAAEAMAWGLPGISFDLDSLKTYYPQGMIKIPCYQLDQFANTIIKLLQDKTYYHRQSHTARQLIVDYWNWKHQAKNIYRQIFL